VCKKISPDRIREVDFEQSEKYNDEAVLGNLKDKLAKTRETFKEKFDEFLSSDKDKEGILEDLSEILILADVSVRSSEKIIASLREKTKKTDPFSRIKELLGQEIFAILSQFPSDLRLNDSQSVVMFVGVNGGGRTLSWSQRTRSELPLQNSWPFGEKDLIFRSSEASMERIRRLLFSTRSNPSRHGG
jgi:signal recognition particle GTPase